MDSAWAKASGFGRPREQREIERAKQLGLDGPARDADSATCAGAIETAKEFGFRICAEALRRVGEWAAEKIVIADGVVRIRNLADAHFPRDVQIVDLFMQDNIRGMWRHCFTHMTLRRSNAEEVGNRLSTSKPTLIGCAIPILAERSSLDPVSSKRAANRRCAAQAIGMHWNVRGANAIIALR